jgi:large subunit ribosomal protein L23
MSQERLLKVLLGPHVSEKSTRAAERRQHVFKVMSCATKLEIKSAVELLFKVKVDAVRVANVRGKSRRFGNVEGHKKSWKKAYVSLQEGHDIQFVDAK